MRTRPCESYFKYLPQNVSGHALRKAIAGMDSIYEYLRRNQTSEAFDACVKRFLMRNSHFG